MGETVFARPRGRGGLFSIDFDAPPEPAAPPEPEVIEPVFSIAELDAARAEAWRDGHAAAMADAVRDHEAVARDTLATVAAALADARSAAVGSAQDAAEALARLLFDCFASAFPSLAARQGEAEVRSIVSHVVPLMHHEPTITVRVSPNAAEIIERDIAILNPDLADQVRVIATDTVAVGDVRIAWRNGTAVRDTAAIWANIESVLAPAGLLTPQSTHPLSAPPLSVPPLSSHRQTVRQETSDVR